MLLVGIDPCFSCNDRRVTIRRAGRDPGMDLGRSAEVWSECLQMNITFPPVLALLIFPGGLALLAGGLLYEWVDRKLVARFQNRIGPRWFQPLADIQAAGKGGDHAFGVDPGLFTSCRWSPWQRH